MSRTAVFSISFIREQVNTYLLPTTPPQPQKSRSALIAPSGFLLRTTKLQLRTPFSFAWLTLFYFK